MLSHPSSYLNPSPLSKPPFPLPPPHYESVLFSWQQFPMRWASEMRGNFYVMFWFHFWHLISNLNGYQGQISAYLPAPSYQVLMQMHPICYLEWRCLVLKDADSLCEKSFSPDNDKGTKWEITPQAKGVTSCILKQKYSIKFKVCLCCILNLNIAHEWSWTYRNHEGWFSISNQDKHISIQTMLINP